MPDELAWHCIGHNPERWGLGIRDEDVLGNIHANVWQNPDGSWNWSLVNGCLSEFGNEPNRWLAMEVAQKENEQR